MSQNFLSKKEFFLFFLMTIELDPPKEIQTIDLPPLKRNIIEDITSNEIYKNAHSFREQLGILYNAAEKIGKKTEHSNLTIRDISKIYKVSKSTVYEHIKKYNEDKKREVLGEEPRKNGRPKYCHIKKWRNYNFG